MNNNNKPKRHSSPLIKKILEEIAPEQKQRVANKMLLAARLDDLMQARGWGKSQFAEKVGRNPSEITKWLSGTHNFTIETLTDISLAFGISLSELHEPKEVQVIYKTHIVVRTEYIETAKSLTQHYVGDGSLYGLNFVSRNFYNSVQTYQS